MTNVPNHISSVQFFITSEEDILKQSVVHVKDGQLYQKNMPQRNGILDHRMGPIDNKVLCGTCQLNQEHCNGHPGHITLAVPCYNPIYYKFILSILQCVCHFCSHILLPKNKRISKHVQNDSYLSLCHFKSIHHFITGPAKTKIISCPYCKAPQPAYIKYIHNKTFAIQKIWKDEALELFSEAEYKQVTTCFTTAEAYSILSNIPHEDIKLLGMNPQTCHPKNMMITVLQVPPIAIRPSIHAGDGKTRGQNDLTRKLREILQSNHHVKDQLYDPDISDTEFNIIRKDYNQLHQKLSSQPQILGHAYMLQYHIVTYFQNSKRLGLTLATTRSGLAYKGIIDRLNGKHGRIRGNLVGKRVDFSARAVVSPDPTLDLDQLGVPLQIALTHTFPEVVQPFNIKHMYNYIHIGYKKLGGAYSYEDLQHKLYHLQHISDQDRANIKLLPGFIIHRYLKNDDYVLFNRQPSLHKKSLMAHRVRIMHTGATFRLNLSVTTPYNADFDGDEMNMHVPQSSQVMAELKEICHVQKQMLNGQTSKGTFGLVQDVLTGIYLMSQRDIMLTREEVMNLMMEMQKTCELYNPNYTLPVPCILKPEPLWSGKQMFSMLLPPTYTILPRAIRQAKSADSEQDIMSQDESVIYLRRGELLTGTLCKQMVGSSAGGIIHTLTLDHGDYAACIFLSDVQRVVNRWLRGFGFSVGISDCILNPTVKKSIQEYVQFAYDQIDTMYKNIPQQYYNEVESTVTDILRKVVTQTGTMTYQNIPHDNRIVIMAKSGSKGNVVNLSQIMSCVGQQTVDGNRLQNKTSKRPVLSCFAPHDMHPKTRGFCQNSYLDSLDPAEFFMCAMGGREGLVDTAVKTAVTGYTQRKMVKAMEAHQVRFDGSVRNAQGHMIQWVYGTDGIDPQYLETYHVPFFTMNDDELYQYINYEEYPDEYNILTQAKQLCMLDKSNAYVYKNVSLPIHFPRILYALSQKDYQGPVVTYQEIQNMRTCIQTMLYSYYNKMSFCVLYFIFLCFTTPHLWISKYKWTSQHLNDFSQIILEKIQTTRSQQGEMVGAHASESVGEPLTQMTLNTFHMSGVGNKNVSMGIPRINELIAASRDIKTPSMTIYLQSNIKYSENIAKHLAQSMIYMSFEHVITSHDIIQCKQMDPYLLQLFHHENVNPERWMIRCYLNKRKLTEKNIIPCEIISSIQSYLKERTCDFYYSPARHDTWMVGIYIHDVYDLAKYSSLFENHQERNERILLQNLLYFMKQNLVLCGVPGIHDASIRQIPSTKEYVIDTQGSTLKHVFIITGVDWVRTLTNDVSEVYNMFGIMAACKTLYRELKSVLSFDGGYVNERHILLLAQSMCMYGFIMPMSRHGINRLNTGVLMRLSFEESTEMLTMASIFNESDKLLGITESIIVGSVSKMGTGSIHTYSDPTYMWHKQYNNGLKSNHVCQSIITEMEQIMTSNVNHDIPSPPIQDKSDDENEDAGPIHNHIPHNIEPLLKKMKLAPLDVGESGTRSNYYYNLESPVLNGPIKTIQQPPPEPTSIKMMPTNAPYVPESPTFNTDSLDNIINNLTIIFGNK